MGVKEGLVLINVVKTYPGVSQALFVDAAVFVLIGLADITVNEVFRDLNALLVGGVWVEAPLAKLSSLCGLIPFDHGHVGPLGAMGRVVPIVPHV